MCLIWGSTWVVIAEGLDHLPAFTSAAVRFWLAAIVMALVTVWLGGKEGGDNPPVHLVLAMGVLNFAVSYGIVYWTETRLPSSVVAVLWATYPMMMAGAAHWMIPGEKLRGGQWLGMLLGFGGVVLLFQTDLARIEGAGLPGAILLLSPMVSAVGTALVKRDGGGVSSLKLNRNGMFLGAALITVMAFVTDRGTPAEWTPKATASVVYLAIIGTCLGFGLFYWSMKYVAAYKLSLIAYITPAIALYLGAVMRDEQVTSSLIMGGVIVLLGCGWVMALGRRSATDT